MTVWFVGWWLGFSSELVGCRTTLDFGNSKIWHRHYEIGVSQSKKYCRVREFLFLLLDKSGRGQPVQFGATLLIFNEAFVLPYLPGYYIR